MIKGFKYAGSRLLVFIMIAALLMAAPVFGNSVQVIAFSSYISIIPLQYDNDKDLYPPDKP